MMKKITALFAMLMMITFMAACGPASQAMTNTPDASEAETPSSMETATADASASTENVDELIAMVNDYVTSGEITGQAENGLLAKLENIRQKAMNGQLDPAANEMNAFINEVQAQLGKKISDPAGTALIAKAQEVANEFMAGVPVTSGEGTAVSTPSSDDMTLPTPLGEQQEHQDQWDGVAMMVVQNLNLSTFDYDLYQLPAGSTWEATLAHYQSEAAAMGWGDAPSQTNEMQGGHYAVWSVTGGDGTSYFVVAQVDTPEGTSYTVNITGK